MGKELDIDDVAAQSPKAMRELTELRQGFERYEVARRMNPQAWQAAWQLNVTTGKPFDEIIDQLMPFLVPIHLRKRSAKLTDPLQTKASRGA